VPRLLSMLVAEHSARFWSAALLAGSGRRCTLGSGVPAPRLQISGAAVCAACGTASARCRETSSAWRSVATIAAGTDDGPAWLNPFLSQNLHQPAD